ncbi:hypothetical protein FSARC_8150 [Fusarium sarcochroum]|uniref:Uncharacterized protein n=1 Tax=Fusarium sarcochroum TaxID=1208366 RepID=A0A8H4TTV0_9HYPO|nr:hypothetical protein FSARC_8150 [Fusarium sarcochroum]
MASTSSVYGQDSIELGEVRRGAMRDTRAADAERTDAERTDAERTDAERTDAERTDAERTDAERTDAERTDSSSTTRLEKIEYHKAMEYGLPPLTFRPTVLGNVALYLSLAFYLSIIGILVYLHQIQKFRIKSVWAYFVIKILPTILGTITSIHMDAIAMALSRITSFILCADTSTRSDGGSAKKALFSSYLPFFITTAVSFVTSFIVALKASFLLTEYYKMAIVVTWAVETLIAIYGFLVIFLFCLLISLKWRAITGLRWDPVSIADQLALFRHSNFLEEFAGTCFGYTQRILHSMGKQKLRLGYWKRGPHYWHGFGIVNDRLQGEEVQTENPSSDVTEETRLHVNEISFRRYSSASATVRPWAVWPFTLFMLVLLAGTIVFIIMGSSSQPKYTFRLPFSLDVAVILISFVLTFFVGLCTNFFETLSDFIAETEPFVHLAEKDDPSKTSFGNASETILLNYTSLSLPVAIHTSFIKGHWKVLRTKVMGKVQHLFPIIVAGSFTLYEEEEEGSTLWIDFPFFVVIAIWLALCLIWIPFETLSSLLRGNIPGGTESDPYSGDPLNIIFVPEDQDTSSRSNISGQERNGNVNSVPSPKSQYPIKRTAYDREHMEARLTLTNVKFCFGLARLSREDMYAVGIYHSSGSGIELERKNQRSKLLRFLWPTARRYDSASDEDDGLYRIEGLRESAQTSSFQPETQGVTMQLRPIVAQEENQTEP